MMKKQNIRDNNLRSSNRLIGCLGKLIVLLLSMCAIAYFVGQGLLGCACGSKESEAKSNLGAVNRAQQSYYAESEQFSQTLENLEIPINNPKHEYYTFRILGGNGTGIVVAYGINNRENATRDYVAGVNFNVDKREFNTIICRMNNKENYFTISSPHTAITNYGEVSDENSEMKCNEGEKVR